MKTEICMRCGKAILASSLKHGLCGICRGETPTPAKAAAAEAERAVQNEQRRLTRDMILTTETAHNLPVKERLGIVTAETVLGVNVLKDMVADVRGAFGGRSKTLQNELRSARDTCLAELRTEAVKLGANAVVGIDFDYNDFGTSGKMLAVIVTGTAVRL